MCVCRFYSELLSVGLLQPLDCPIEGLKDHEGTENYVTPLGTSSIVKHFLSQSGKRPPVGQLSNQIHLKRTG